MRFLFSCILITFFFVSSLYSLDKPYQSYGFYDQSGRERKLPLKIIGKVVEVKYNKQRLLARMFEENITKNGESLFILNPNGLIIGKLKVNYIVETLYFGQMISASGHFRLIPPDSLIGQSLKLGEEQRELLQQYIARADNYFHDNSPGEAIRYYKKALSLDSENPSALFGLGKSYYQQRLFSLAESHFQKAYARISDLQDLTDKLNLLQYMAAMISRQAGSLLEESTLNGENRKVLYQKALSYLQEGLVIAPKSSKFNFLVARTYFELDQFQKTLHHSRLSIRFGSLYLQDSYLLIAQSFERLGSRAKALAYYKKALLINPASLSIQERVQKLQNEKS